MNENCRPAMVENGDTLNGKLDTIAQTLNNCKELSSDILFRLFEHEDMKDQNPEQPNTVETKVRDIYEFSIDILNNLHEICEKLGE